MLNLDLILGTCIFSTNNHCRIGGRIAAQSNQGIRPLPASGIRAERIEQKPDASSQTPIAQSESCLKLSQLHTRQQAGGHKRTLDLCESKVKMLQ